MANLSIFRKFYPLYRTNNEVIQGICMLKCRNASWHTNTIKKNALDRLRVSPLNKDRENVDLEKSSKDRKTDIKLIRSYREKYPEFLPDPDWRKRDRVAEMVEREDMHRRRSVIEIPEFYVGSIVAVTVSDKFAPGKSSRFLGICIRRYDHGLDHRFILRNVIDDEGIEVMYEMYSPLILKIEVVVLEKRLDDELLYLRDCPLKYSYFPQDLEPQVLHDVGNVPVNDTMVELGPRPWTQRWERADLKGVQEYTGWKNERVKQKAMKSKEHPQVKKTWEKTDIMKHYRESINLVESAKIYKEVAKKRRNWFKKKKKVT